MLALLRFLSCVFFLLTQLVFADQVPPPTYTIHVPMRDGTALATDLYLQDPHAKNLPCILIRTPAGRHEYTQSFIPLAKAGYLVAIQETRCLIDPEKKTFPYVSDGWGDLQDGYDSIEWFANSSWTNGKVGTLGFSAMGITQLLTAPTNPPNLCCQYIGMASASMYHHGMCHGGQCLKNLVEGWLEYHKHHPSVLRHISKELDYNAFWQGLDALSVAHHVHVPGLLYGGWYDIFSQGTIGAFLSRQEYGGQGAKGKQKLVMGPWTHLWPMDLSLGDFKVPENGIMPPFDISPLRWMDHYLRGVENGVDSLPSVIYYVMGPFDGSPSSGNVWKTAKEWPVPSTATPFYLLPGKRLETTSIQSQRYTHYISDPNHPVPTIGGHNLFIESGPRDQRPIEIREDVLVFTTEPLEKDIEVTGRIFAKIYFKTDADTCDVAIRLCDVYPDGRSILISDGIYSLLPGEKNQEGPDEAYVDLWSTSIVFAKGHRIRVSVSGSNYPRFEKNNNVARRGHYLGPPHVAHNEVYLGGEHASHIVLPVVKD